jgi:hypothetical protein
MLSVYTARRTTVFTAIFAGVVSLFGASTTALHAQALGGLLARRYFSGLSL